MQNSGGVPGVAQILDRDERGSQLRRFGKIAARASLEQLPAKSWGKAAGTCREARQCPILQMNNRRTLADAANHKFAIHAAEQILQESVLRWIVAHHRVFDPDANAIIN